MNALHLLFTVLRKELTDGFRDRRSLSTLIFGATMTPLIFGLMFSLAAGRERGARELKLPVDGVEHAPALAEWLRQQTGVTLTQAPRDAVEAIRNRKEDVIVIVDKDYAKKLERGEPAQVKIVADATRSETRTKVNRVRELLRGYASEIASLRLIARGVSPTLAQPLRVEDVEVSSAQQRLAQLLAVLPLLLVIAGLTGGMPIAIDATAGERERGSLEPLLLNPVPRWVLAAGKWLAASTFACLSVLFSMVLTVTVFRRIPWHDMGIRFRISDGELMSLLALILPLALLLTAVLVFTSTFARSFKEAQGSVGLLMMLPMLPGLVATVYPLTNRPYLAPLPIVGQYALAADVLAGKPAPAAYYVLAGLAAVAVALLLVAFASRLLRREAVIFGR